MMRITDKQPGHLLGLLMLGLTCVLPAQQVQAAADVRGLDDPATGSSTFNLYAFPFNMNLPDGSSVHMWGFGDMEAGAKTTHPLINNPVSGGTESGSGYGLPQYPAPTLIINQGDSVTINMTNYGVPQAVSIVVTGQNVTASCTSGTCTSGLLTMASANGNETVSYTFTANDPGTFIYHSLDGNNPGLHTEMGLAGAIIVRPTAYDAETNRIAYTDDASNTYDHEYLYLLTELDPGIHFEVERGHFSHFTNHDRYATMWFVNGRVFPDLFQGDFNPLFPHQPYQALAKSTPIDKVLIRHVNVGQDSHPFHYHGENWFIVGRDGKLLSSDGVTANLGRSDNTINSAAKQAVDLLWTWTGKGLNWDIYGSTDGSMGDPFYTHDCIDGDGDGFGDVSAGSSHEGEYCADHNKPFPVNLPSNQELTLGGWWGGSPFLGDTAGLPPGEGGLNPFGGYFLVWHSHSEKELTTDDIFPGGSLSSVVILPPELSGAIE